MIASLPISVAQRDIAIYEQAYWKSTGEHPAISDCRRHSARQVTCEAQIIVDGEWVTTTDWATLLSHGVVRVHPGEFQIVVRT